MGNKHSLGLRCSQLNRQPVSIDSTPEKWKFYQRLFKKGPFWSCRKVKKTEMKTEAILRCNNGWIGEICKKPIQDFCTS